MSVIQIFTVPRVSDKQKLSLWGRQSTFAGAPSALVADRRNNRTRSENRTTSYGFGSGIDRFSHIQTSPNSPVQERPVSWYVRDIDIGDIDPKGSGSDPAKPEPDMFGHRPMRRRSRHECHFQTGCHVPVGKEMCHSYLLPFNSSNLFISSRFFWLNKLLVTLYNGMYTQPLMYNVFVPAAEHWICCTSRSLKSVGHMLKVLLLHIRDH